MSKLDDVLRFFINKCVDSSYVVNSVHIYHRIYLWGIRDEDVLCSAALQNIVDKVDIAISDFNSNIINILHQISKPCGLSSFELEYEYFARFAKNSSEELLLMALARQIFEMEMYYYRGQKEEAIECINKAFPIIDRVLNVLKKNKKDNIKDIILKEIQIIEDRLGIKYCKPCKKFIPQR